MLVFLLLKADKSAVCSLAALAELQRYHIRCYLRQEMLLATVTVNSSIRNPAIRRHNSVYSNISHEGNFHIFLNDAGNISTACISTAAMSKISFML